MVNPLDLMLEVIKDHTPVSKWSGATLETFRQVANTNRGDIGEDFVFRYLSYCDIPVVRPLLTHRGVGYGNRRQEV